MFARKLTYITIALLIVSLGGCATSRKVQVVQPGDNRLSCQDLKKELFRVSKAQKDVNSKKGVTGTNVAAALLWLPGLAYTYYDAGQAGEALRARQAKLTTIFNQKRCTV